MAKVTRGLEGRRFVALAVVLILGILLGISISALQRQDAGGKKSAVVSGGKNFKDNADMCDAFTEVAASVGPAVVSISTERTQKIRVSPFGYSREGSPFHDEFFQRFFGDMFRNAPRELERKQAGMGTGVVIDKEGFILTNEHVISGADKITVAFPDGRKFEGAVKGSDKRSDLAIVKVNARGLPYAPLGDSDLVRTGQWVVAIGNPFGYIVDSAEPTVTAGVISALHRSLPSRKSGYFDLIQTDAAINPGNSGGPLCDLNGEVIGINVAIFSTSGGYQGVGFAIPINLAKAVIDDLKRGRKVSYGWMGVVIQDVNEDLAKYFGLPSAEGVLISQVVEGSPAEKAGIRAGDVVVEINDKPTRETKDLIMAISRVPVGANAKVELIRDRRQISLEVKVAQIPTEEDLARMQGRELPSDERVVVQRWRGLDVYPITDEIVMRFNIQDREGVLVVNVEPASQAYYAALKQGDIIKRVDTKKIESIQDYKEAIKGLKGDVLVYTDRGFTIVKE